MAVVMGPDAQCDFLSTAVGWESLPVQTKMKPLIAWSWAFSCG